VLVTVGNLMLSKLQFLHLSPVAANEAVVSNGNALCSPTFGGLDNVAGSKL
jgi:hypothetical protein